MPESIEKPPWISWRHLGVLLACVVLVLFAAYLQHTLVVGKGIEPEYFFVPAIVGLVFGLIIIVVVRLVRINRVYAQRLRQRADRIERLNRDLEERVVARTAELAEKQEELLRTQHLDMVGRLVGGGTHDFRNILTVIQGNAESLVGEVAEPEALNSIMSAVDRGERIAGQLLATTRRSRSKEFLPLHQLVDDLVQLLSSTAGKALDIETAHEGESRLVDSGRVEQILLNLIINARDAQPDGGRIVVKTDDLEGSNRLLIEVQDEGPGIDEEVGEKIFDLFFTTKSGDQGSGLGLATVRDLVGELSGDITFDSTATGTTFRVELPYGE